jgi:alpha-glucosidase
MASSGFDNNRMTPSYLFRYLPVILIFSLIACFDPPAIELSSPNGMIFIKIQNSNDQILYQVSRNDRQIIQPSQLGLILGDNRSLTKGFIINTVITRTVDDHWSLPWGEVNTVKNHFNECRILFRSSDKSGTAGEIIFRAYNDGIAFRYHVKQFGDETDIIIRDEITEFNLTEDAESWWVKAYQPSRYEYLYQSTKISEIDTVHTPFTMRFDDGIHLSIHEAGLVDYSSMQIAGTGSTRLHCDLAPWSNGDKVRTTVPFKTPWRTIMITDSASELLASNLTLNCNEPNVLGDVSWVKPSKYVGIWWGMITGKWTWGTGFRHGATTERGKRYIDFAAENGFDEVLIEGWVKGWQGLFPSDSVTVSFTETTEDFDLREVQGYARSRGVSLQSYQETMAATHNYLAQIDSSFRLMNELGIRNVKIGQVGHLLDRKEFHYSQYGVDYYRKVLEKAAEHRISVNFHEPIKDTGERRTYPNMLTREGARGMEYNAWGNRGNPPDHTTILPFTRLLNSPMDFTPGIFDILYEKLDTTEDPEYSVTFVVVDSGNGFQNLRYKGAESFWQNKKMTCDTSYSGVDTVYRWTLGEDMKRGEWEWGVSATDPLTGNQNFWLLSLLRAPNRKLLVNSDGNYEGQTTIIIPKQADRVIQQRPVMKEYVDMNEFGVTQRVNTTLAKQLALYVIIYSPLQMASDFIENYVDQPAFQFIRDVPVDWDTTIVLNAEVGEYVTLARKDRHSHDWYLGSITNTDSRQFEVDLDFLDDDLRYEVEQYMDAEDTNWETNPLETKIDRQRVMPGDNYIVKLAPGGGQAVRFRALTNP